MKRSKKYNAVASKVDKTKKYPLEAALKLLPEISISKFPGSIGVQLFLNLNEKQKKESIRGSYTLPHSFGKSIIVLAIVDKNDLEKAKAADFAGGEELFKDIESGKIQADIIITTPMMMPKLAKLGKSLGAKGLMPNPKNGTITSNLEATINKFKQGMKNFKSINGSPINAVIGKTDMPVEKLLDNMNAFLKAVVTETKKYSANPVKRALMSPSMGPKIELDTVQIGN